MRKITDVLKLSGDRLVNTLSTSKLSGNTLEVCCTGEFPHSKGAVTQVVTGEDIAAMHENFQRYKNSCEESGGWNGLPILGNLSVGYPHGDDGPAFAWAKDSRIGNNTEGKEALFLELELTPLGNEHIGTTFKEFSPDWIGQRLANGEWHPAALVNICLTNNANIKTNRLANAEEPEGDWKKALTEKMVELVGDSASPAEAIVKLQNRIEELNSERDRLWGMRQVIEAVAKAAGIDIRVEWIEKGEWTVVQNSMTEGITRLVDAGFAPRFDLAVKSRLANADDRDKMRALWLKDPSTTASLLGNPSAQPLPGDPLRLENAVPGDAPSALAGGGREPSQAECQEITRLANSLPGGYDSNFTRLWNEFLNTGKISSPGK